MAIFQKPRLRVRDDQKTNAAELTLRESIYPLCLVTILFFLWVSALCMWFSTAEVD
jgi:FHS family L-fucose permease-like MFS transporter